MDATSTPSARTHGARGQRGLPSTHPAHTRGPRASALRAHRGEPLIILFHPRAVKPRSRRLPLAVLALAAVLEGVEEYEIVDGNVDDDPLTWWV